MVVGGFFSIWSDMLDFRIGGGGLGLGFWGYS